MGRRKRELKAMYEFIIIMLIIFGLCFAVTTLGYNITDPAIISLKVVRYGFPMSWLKTITHTIELSPTQYIILWTELIVDIVFYLALSAIISFIIIKAKQQRETFTKVSQLVWIRFLFIILVAYLTMLITCGIHELLGHGLWAWVFGAESVWIYVSWLGFGWCRWHPHLESPLANVMAMAGGLINTLLVGAAILMFLFFVRRKGGIYLRSFFFWLGFWAVITQAGYLLIGGFITNSDPWQLHLMTGIPISFFLVLGFVLFLLVYPILSILFLRDVSKLFLEYSRKALLFMFWLSVPMQAILFMISPEYTIPFQTFLFLLALSMIPSLLSLPLFKFFNRARSNI